ncbi:hypothetical protein GGR55DRAFT_644895 [Xylaria sp. FL0064]|nr:hypothetical protein GGR55DRAFT_644895 [Xylaria sp. FL0064]
MFGCFIPPVIHSVSIYLSIYLCWCPPRIKLNRKDSRGVAGRPPAETPQPMRLECCTYIRGDTAKPGTAVGQVETKHCSIRNTIFNKSSFTSQDLMGRFLPISLGYYICYSHIFAIKDIYMALLAIIGFCCFYHSSALPFGGG